MVGDGVGDMLTIEKGGAVFEYCCACARGIKVSSVINAVIIINAYSLVIIFDIEPKATYVLINHTLFKYAHYYYLHYMGIW